MNIRLVPREEFDKQLYDSCVHYATNGNIYGYHWFLNATTDDWDVLVEDNWSSVMPLPKTKNWLGRTRLEQPRLISDLAVYSVNVLSPKRVQAFWDAIPKEYRSGNLTVEPASAPKVSDRFTVEAATGTALTLNRSYEQIIEDFSPGYYEGLVRAEMARLRPASSFKPERLADLWLQVNGKTAENEWRYHAMQRIMYQVLHRGWGGTQAVQDDKGEILAMVFLAYSHHRIFPLFTVETAEGKSVGALTFLWDNILKSHAGKELKVRREEILV